MAKIQPSTLANLQVSNGQESARLASNATLGRRYYQPALISDAPDEQGNTGTFGSAETQSGEQVSKLTRAILILYLSALLFPVLFKLSSFTFTANRAFLTAMILPVVLGALAKTKFHPGDVLVLAYAFWASICFIVNQGLLQSIEPSGSHFAEVVGSYFLARLAFRSVADYVVWSKLLLLAIVFLLPLAIYEAVTSHPILLDLLRPIVPVHADMAMPPRLGFDRAQTVFEHPILYGIFCAGSFSAILVVYAHSKSTILKAGLGAIVGVATFFSFASGAYLNIFWQLLILAWNRAFKVVRSRWKLLVILTALVYVSIDIVSNRTPFEVFISRFTFDLGSSYMRVSQWKWGIEEVYRNPIFGMGLFSDWVRPEYVTMSVDNFWLVRAMRFGFPGMIFLALLIVACMRGAARHIDSSDPLLSAVSLALLSTLVGSCISLVTVDIWSASHSLFFFGLGAIASLPRNRSESLSTASVPEEISVANNGSG